MSSTTPEDFTARLKDGHRVVPVIREIFADGETPIGVYRKLAAGRPGTFLLESAEHGGIWSRYSFVGVSSFGVLTQHGDLASWMDYGLPVERALGDDHPTCAARGARTSLRALEHAARRRPPAAHGRARGLHRLGGDPRARTPARRPARRLRRTGAGARLRLRTRRARPPARHRAAHRGRAGRRRRAAGRALGRCAASARRDAGRPRAADRGLARRGGPHDRARADAARAAVPVRRRPSSARKRTSATATCSRS